MSKLLTLTGINLAFGLHPLLNQAKLDMDRHERLCLIGRNGEGKSSFLKIIEGTLLADAGTIWRQPHTRIARLHQTLPEEKNMTIYQYVASGLEKLGQLLAHYHHQLNEVSRDPSTAHLKALEKTQQEMDRLDGWQFEHKVSTVLTQLHLSPDDRLHHLSGGWQKKAALAQALVTEPDLLLLDEPTNHLDIDTIQWLETYLLNTKLSLIFVTHDRKLMQTLATRILELDRGQLTSWDCDYATFLVRKEAQLKTEELHHREFDKKLAQEEKWIRQGIKARRTRNEGRVRALKALRAERKARREQKGAVKFNLNDSQRSGRLVFETEQLTYQLGEKKLIDQLSLRIMEGDRVGIIGKNGSGKSTLIRLLLGELIPTKGSVRQGTQLSVTYFDQERAALDLDKSVRDNVSEGRDFIEVDGKSVHIMTYLSHFLFNPERAMTAVRALSGGECNRLLLAKLFTQPTNLLIMDEPTNDLDIETLELLEELLLNYKGTLLIVSHDRYFLNQVVTSTLCFFDDGHLEEFVGGYQDYLEQRDPFIHKKTPVKAVPQSRLKVPVMKLTFKEEKELSQLPKQIERLETELAEYQTQTQHPDFFKQDEDTIKLNLNALAQVEAKINEAYQRWEALEAKQPPKRVDEN